MSDTFRLLREAFPETLADSSLADSSVDVAIRRLQRHQAEADAAINAAMDWLALAPKDNAPIQFSELAIMMMKQEHAAAVERSALQRAREK